MLKPQAKPDRVNVVWGGSLCLRFIISPGGESHFPRWKSAQTELGLISHQKVKWAEAPMMAWQGSDAFIGLLVTLIAELLSGGQ